MKKLKLVLMALSAAALESLIGGALVYLSLVMVGSFPFTFMQCFAIFLAISLSKKIEVKVSNEKTR